MENKDIELDLIKIDKLVSGQAIGMEPASFILIKIIDYINHLEKENKDLKING